MPAPLGLGLALAAAGLFLVLAAFRSDGLGFGAEALLPLYCLGLLSICVLIWWDATRRRMGVLPSWTSPPVLIAVWALAWIYLPALVALVDDNLLDELTLARGGGVVLLTGLWLTCCGLAVLSLSYRVTTLALRRPVRLVGRAEHLVPLRRAVALYLVSVAARALRLVSLGVAFGADLAAWGPLRSVDQWIGYIEDLRFLALVLLVAHAVRRNAGYFWLGTALIIELVMGISSGFLTPVILPIVSCVVTVAAFDRLRSRDVALAVVAAFFLSTFVPVIAALRQDRTGTIGTADLGSVGYALTAPAKYWLAGVSAGDGVYDKFFGRQAEVASAPGLVVMLTPAVVPHEGLERFLTLPAGLIPRAVWPDKPSLSRGVWFSVVFRGLPEDTTSYSAMTIFSEGYLFYGWTGTVLAMLMVGIILAVVRRCLDNSRLALVYLALAPTILQIEPEFSSYLITLTQRTLVFVAVFTVLNHGRLQSAGRSEVRP